MPGQLPPTRSAPLSSIFEADNELHADPTGTISTLHALGVDTVRVFIPWGSLGATFGSIAPAPTSPTKPAGFDGADPAAYPAANWRVYDAAIAAAHNLGMRVDLTLGPPPPLWARGPGDPGHPDHPQWRPNIPEFAKWVHAVAIRYGGHFRDPATGTVLPKVDMWAIWNEPNFGPMISPQVSGQGVDSSPAIYRAMVDAAWRELHATGHARDTILIGELAPYGHALGAGPGLFGYMVPAALRARPVLRRWTAPPTERRGRGAAGLRGPGIRSGPSGPVRRERAFGAPLRPGSTNGVGPRPARLRQPPRAAPRRGDPRRDLQGVRPDRRQLPLYSTEFGVHTNPPEKVFGTLSPPAAAIYLNQAEYLTWRDPRLRSYDQYLLHDGPTGIFATGLENFSGTPKPGYAAYLIPLFLPVRHLSAGKPLEVWGGVRPARYASRGKQHVALQFRRPGADAFRTVRTIPLSGRSIYFDLLQRFPGPGAVRTVWHAPDGRIMVSRAVTHPPLTEVPSQPDAHRPPPQLHRASRVPITCPLSSVSSPASR